MAYDNIMYTVDNFEERGLYIHLNDDLIIKLNNLEELDSVIEQLNIIRRQVND